MTEDQELKFRCLDIAHGRIDTAREIYEWLTAPAVVAIQSDPQGIGDGSCLPWNQPGASYVRDGKLYYTEADGTRTQQELEDIAPLDDYGQAMEPAVAVQFAFVDHPEPEPTAPAAEEPAVEIPEGFTRWEGGECPVADKVHVEVLQRSGKIMRSKPGYDEAPIIHPEDEFHWDVRVNPMHDIIAYRIISAPEPTLDDLIADKTEELRAKLLEDA